MASSSAPLRPYSSALGKFPDRSGGAFGAPTTTAQQREAQRQERERERLEKERLDREGQDPMNQLTEEQKEEINEAVGHFSHPETPGGRPFFSFVFFW